MQLIVQSVAHAELKVWSDHQQTQPLKSANIWTGILIYFGVSKADESREDWQIAIDKFTHKLTTLKLLASPEGKIETPLSELGNQVMIISNFTIFGKYKNGTKIDFSQSGSFAFSQKVYEYFIQSLEQAGFEVASGIFGAEMEVNTCNQGPINYLWEL